MKKPTLAGVMAQKSPPQPEPPPVAKEKADDGKITTSLRISPDVLGELKLLAVQRRCRVNDLVLEGINNILALNGRSAA